MPYSWSGDYLARGTGFYPQCESSDLPLLARLNGAPTLVALKIENFQLVSAPNNVGSFVWLLDLKLCERMVLTLLRKACM